MYEGRKIIVSLTTWSKRIQNVYKTIDSLLKQNLMPDSIELNLSEEEFPNKEKSLPDNIQVYLKEYVGIVNCNWVYKNTRTFKKIIPTIQKYKDEPEYLLLSVDDDMIYRDDYIEMMVKYLDKYNGDSFCLSKYKVIGNRQIYKSTCFTQDFYSSLTDEVISYGIDDEYTQHYLLSKGKILTNYRPDDVTSIITIHDENNPLHDEYKKDNRISKAITAIKKIKFNK